MDRKLDKETNNNIENKEKENYEKAINEIIKDMDTMQLKLVYLFLDNFRKKIK